ncbi:hypothetical protein MN2019_17880 [Mycolicibacterium neoaurum]|uniref:hypothetical protein n=1 Tax=Mycolicibacterium neoaurum TaxID=1795 RepID=UPI001BD14E96|nr:hypothetical protein [Mycolicibacterium neoaurum]QVI26172.1 hypothetical protein MN2019_17880 [Mycolicibacterium neoaurum]
MINDQMRAAPAVIAAYDVLQTLLDSPAYQHPRTVTQLWRTTKAPATAMTATMWRALFLRAGYSHNGQPAQRPTEAVQVFRGATEAGRFGMSWSTERHVAQRFTRQPGGELWTATVQPQHLLAYLNHRGDPEHEYVVDPAGLTDRNVCRDGQPAPEPLPPGPYASRAERDRALITAQATRASALHQLAKMKRTVA